MYKKLLKYFAFTITMAAAANSMADVQLADVKSKFDVTLYGYIKLDAAYDTHKTQGDTGFYALPEVDGEKDNEFSMTARQTRMGLNIGGPDLGDGKLSGKIEVDFYGNGTANNKADIRMRLAYVKWKNDMLELVAGQDWETFITVMPKTVDFSNFGYSGKVGFRRPQFRVGVNAGIVTFKVAAARTIGQDLDGLGQDDGADSGVPSIQGNLMVAPKILTDKASKFSISGVYGTETVDVEDEEAGTIKVDDKDYDSWLSMFSMSLPITSMITLNGTLWTGENIDNYYGGIGQGVNVAKDKGIGSTGGWAQLLVNPIKPLTIGVGYGMDDPDNSDLNAGNRCSNQRISANGFYTFSSALCLMLEYENIKTDYYQSGDDAVTDNRIQAAVQYNF